jgi:diguanylate cyclase (GGDEF)-like protein
LLALIQIELAGLTPGDDVPGAAVGDGTAERVLQEVASRLRSAVRASDTIARIDSDAFVLILPDLADQDAANLVASKVLVTLEGGVEIDGHSLHPRASLGIVVLPADGSTPDQLLQNAGEAAAQAKAAGSRMHRFAGTIEPTFELRHDLARDLGEAIERGQLALEYQPQINLRRQRLVGLEALLRWHHPSHGDVDPETFVELAEASGQIGRIGKWALAHACAAAATWPTERIGPIRVAVNLSTAQMVGDDLARIVARALERSGLPPGRLELELTERSVLGNDECVSERVLAVLGQLRAMGVGLALDDFGTGYASLRHLGCFPLDALKIDRSFVADLSSMPNHAIVQCVIELAHRMGLRVTAEGVESETQLATLRELGCDEAQGHALGKPLPEAEVVAWLIARADSRL